MKKINFNFNLKKFKIKLDEAILRAVVISFLTMLVTLVIIASVAWHYRGRVFHFLAEGYINDNQITNVASTYGANSKSKNIVDKLVDALPVTNSENTVVNAVKRANPAVVAITITKEVPKYDVSYDQNNQTNPFRDAFGNDFPNFFFQTPTYKQNGTEEKKIGGGSGFIISADGYIVTNRHVVADKDAKYTVNLNNGKKYTAKVLARDPVLDVAVIKIDAYNLPYLELADSDTLELGQNVIAIGNALGEYKNTISTGVVSGLSRSVVAGDGQGMSEKLEKVIQTDAAINPGNSGGPLLDLYGRVVGINVAVVQGSENIGFALPINSVKTVISSVQKTGKIVRPYVGIRYVPITEELKNKNNLTVDYGILVVKGATASDLAVIPGSPADKAGLVENDIILEVDGTKVDSDHDFANLIRGKNVGDTLTLKVLSKGVQKTITLKLENAPDNQ